MASLQDVKFLRGKTKGPCYGPLAVKLFCLKDHDMSQDTESFRGQLQGLFQLDKIVKIILRRIDPASYPLDMV
jgi:hypothetical protein